MLNKFLGFMALSISIMSCSSQPLDISKFDFNQPAKNYLKNINVERIDTIKGHKYFNVKSQLVTEGNEISVHYYFTKPNEEKQIVYDNLKLESGSEGKIVEYENSISYLRFAFEPDRSFELREKLIKNLGKPTEVIFETIGYNNKMAFINLITKQIPLEIKSITNEFGDRYFIYPLCTVWVNHNYIYQFTFIDKVNKIGNNLEVYSKKFFNDKILFPSPESDPIRGKYLK